MIKQRKRASDSPELEKAKKATLSKDISRVTIYIPREHLDAIEMKALKARTSISAIMRDVIADFLSSK